MPAHVLVVEDEAQARYSLAQILSRAGYRVSEAADGEQALRLLEHETFALIIADMRMGRVDGLQVLAASQALDEAPAVILLTGYGSLDTALSALRGGVADYLLKPVDPQHLLASVSAALERRSETLYNRKAAQVFAEGFAALQNQTPGLLQEGGGVQQAGRQAAGASQDSIVMGALVVGPHRHAVRYREQPVALTPTEFTILRCLAEAEGHMLSYEALATCTYGYAVGNSEAQVLLKAHVRNLRQKLAAAVLETIRGYGYRLVAT